MAFTNFDSKEINCKVLYCGPAQAGKSENLRALYKQTASLPQPGERLLVGPLGPTRYFDFLPLSLGHVQGYHIKLHLYSFALSSALSSVLSVLLKGVDGLVFVADSCVAQMAANLEALEQLKLWLGQAGYEFSHLPQVFQYNKRDLCELVTVPTLRAELNPWGFPEYEAVATRALGTYESLEAMAKQMLERLAA